MEDVVIGPGDLAGKGVYAARDFRKGEVVIKYRLRPLTEAEFEGLPDSERMFTHRHGGVVMLYAEPERYVNHSSNPNTRQDLDGQADIALRNIARGEAITTDATKDDI